MHTPPERHIGGARISANGDLNTGIVDRLKEVLKLAKCRLSVFEVVRIDDFRAAFRTVPSGQRIRIEDRP